jgi:hypothetical protein
MAYLCSQWTPKFQIKYFMFYWSIYRKSVLNRGWKRDSLQTTIFVYICSTWSIVQIKTRFETWITRNDVNGVSLFNLSNLITLIAYLCLQRTQNFQIRYYMLHWSIYRVFVLNTGWKRDSLQLMIFVNVSSTWWMVQLKSCFDAWITRNDVNGVRLNHFSYLITLMGYLCSQWTTNVQIKYFMFDWSIYRQLVLNRSWKRNSFQTRIFSYVSSTWSIVELKKRFETWVTRNAVNCVSLIQFSYLITLMLTCAHKGHQISKSRILCLIGRSTGYLW